MMMNSDLSQTLAPEEEPTIDLRQYIALFLQWWWLILAAGILAGVSTYIYSKQLTPIYQSSTTLLINEAPSTSTTDYNSLITSERLAQTYAQIMTTRPVMEKVIDRLNIPYTPEELSEMITVSPVRDTQLLVVTVESDDPNVSASVANATVLVFGEQVQETQRSRFSASEENLKKQISDAETQIADIRQALQKTVDRAERDRLETRQNQYEQIYANLVVSYEQIRMTEAQTSSSVVQVEQAQPNRIPVKPNTARNTLLATVVGLMLAVGGVFLYDALDDTVKSPEEIKRKLNLPVMGTIARYEEPKEGRLISKVHPRSPVTESFRALRTNIQYASVDQPIHTLMITSANPSEGKTTVTSNLAVVLAQGGRRVTLVDADLHRPRIHSMFKAENRLGLSSLFIRPSSRLNGSFQPTDLAMLHLVSAGDLPPNPSELLGSNKMREIIDMVLEKSDVVLIDTPPVLSVTDAVVLAPMVDGVLVVAKPGSTKLSMLKFAVEQLRYVGANVIGVVINGVDEKNNRYGYYYRSYYYKSYQYYTKAAKILGVKVHLPFGKMGFKKSIKAMPRPNALEAYPEEEKMEE